MNKATMLRKIYIWHGARKRLIWVSARKKSNCCIIWFMQFYRVFKEIRSTLYNINAKQNLPSKLVAWEVCFQWSNLKKISKLMPDNMHWKEQICIENAKNKILRKSVPRDIIWGKTDFLGNAKSISILDICLFMSVHPALSKRKSANINLNKKS